MAYEIIPNWVGLLSPTNPLNIPKQPGALFSGRSCDLTKQVFLGPMAHPKDTADRPKFRKLYKLGPYRLYMGL